jgi:Uma2 family endonuclease
MPLIDPALYERLESLPETQIGEILRGEVFASPRPAPRHANIIFHLGGILRGPYGLGRGGPGGWWILPEPEVHLGAEVVVPDLAGWRRENLPIFPDCAAIDVRPDWVCEVLSPSGAARDRVLKPATYAAHGLPYFWLIDPIARVLEARRLTPEGWLIDGSFAEDATVRARPFDAIGFSLADLWPD